MLLLRKWLCSLFCTNRSCKRPILLCPSRKILVKSPYEASSHSLWISVSLAKHVNPIRQGETERLAALKALPSY